MQLQNILELNLRLLHSQTRNHSITETILRNHLFTDNSDPISLADLFLKNVNKNKQNYSSHIFDWLNIFLFNVCAANQQLVTQYQNRQLESTDDVPKFGKIKKKEQSGNEISRVIKERLKIWIQRLFSCAYFQHLFSQLTVSVVAKNKSLRYLLQTIDYLLLKYDISCKHRVKIIQTMQNTAKSNTLSFLQDRISWINQRVFSGGEPFISFMQQITDNYSIDLNELSEIITAAYFNMNPPRKIFQSANNSGRRITEEIIDYIIRKTNKNQLFAQKMESYRPYELLMNVFYQREASCLVQFNWLVSQIMSKATSPHLITQNQGLIQKIGTLFTLTIPHDYPHLHHLFRYCYTSLLAKYNQNDALQLMKKLVLNRFLLNPLYYALFMTPDQHTMQKYVKVANDLRILFYQKKVQTLCDRQNNPQITELGQLLRNSLNNMLKSEVVIQNEFVIKDKGVYINDKLLGYMFCDLNDQLKNEKSINAGKFVQNQSESSLTFSLKNDSMSKMPIQQSQPITIIGSNPSIPNLPRPSQKQVHSTARTDLQKDKNVSQANSSDTFLGERLPFNLATENDKLDQLVMLRRQYGQKRREMQEKASERTKRRQDWQRQLLLLNQPIVTARQEIAKTSNQFYANSLIF